MSVSKKFTSLISDHVQLMEQLRNSLLPRSATPFDTSSDLFPAESVDPVERIEMPSCFQASHAAAKLREAWTLFESKLGPAFLKCKDESMRKAGAQSALTMSCLLVLANEPLNGLVCLAYALKLSSNVDKRLLNTIRYSMLMLSSYLGLWKLVEYLLESCPSFEEVDLDKSLADVTGLAIKACHILVELRKERPESTITRLEACFNHWECEKRTFHSYRAQAILRQITAHAPAVEYSSRVCGGRLQLLDEASHKWRTVIRSHFPDFQDSESLLPVPPLNAANSSADSLLMCIDIYSCFVCASQLGEAYQHSALTREAETIFREGLMLARKLAYLPWCLHFLNRLNQLNLVMGIEDCKYSKMANYCLNSEIVKDNATNEEFEIELCTPIGLERNSKNTGNNLNELKKETQETSLSVSHPVDCECPICYEDSLCNWEATALYLTLQSWTPLKNVKTKKDMTQIWNGISSLKKIAQLHVNHKLDTVGLILGARVSLKCQAYCLTQLIDWHFHYILSLYVSQKQWQAVSVISEKALFSYKSNSGNISTIFYQIYYEFCLRISKLLLSNPKVFHPEDVLVKGLESMSIDTHKTCTRNSRLRSARNKSTTKSTSERDSEMKHLLGETESWLAITFSKYSDYLWYPLRRQMADILALWSYKKGQLWEAAWYWSECNEVGLRQRCCMLLWERKRLKMDNPDEALPPAKQFNSVQHFKESIQAIPKDFSIAMVVSSLLGSFLPPMHFTVILTASNMPIIFPLQFNDKYLQRMENIAVEMGETFKLTDSALFWSMRRKLDAQLKELMVSIEDEAFGSLKWLLLGPVVQPTPQSIDMDINDKNLEVIPILKTVMNRCLQWQVSTLWSDLSSHMTCLKLVSQNKVAQLHSQRQSIEAELRGSVVLILSPELHDLPWECLPVYISSGITPVSRMPNVHMVIRSLELHKCVPSSLDSQNTFYVLDPEGNLPSTSDVLGPIFKKHEQWNGLIKRKPAERELVNALENRDMYLYCGHGSGTRFVTSACIRQSKCKATALLMGCKTAHLKRDGVFLESRGPLHEYSLGASPCVVGCLWNVTDKDIDRYLMGLLAEWIKCKNSEERMLRDKQEFLKKKGRDFRGICDFDENMPPPEQMLKYLLIAITSARKYCRLPYLTGGAVVAYGLPVMSVDL